MLAIITWPDYVNNDGVVVPVCNRVNEKITIISKIQIDKAHSH